MELSPHRVDQSLRFAQIIAEQFNVARVGALKSVVIDIKFEAAMNTCNLKPGFESTVQKVLCDHNFLKAPKEAAASGKEKGGGRGRRPFAAVGLPLG
eukprot:6177926-Pleurochrysis_carterae.AAC.3